jgi:manganese oxidase
MNKVCTKNITVVVAAVSMLMAGYSTHAMINGVTGTTFNLATKTGYISTPDAGSWFMWGYCVDSANPNAVVMQYPGPTLIVNEGDTITVNLRNTLSTPVSIIFPGQSGVVATGGTTGLLTNEAAPNGGTVSYTFVASQPGTYQYFSGTQSDLQIEMGLVGALIVRPATAMQAYNHADSAYNREVLFLQTEIDAPIHQLVEQGRVGEVDMNARFATYWFINGRCAPDTMLDANVPWLLTQPYNCMPVAHPYDRLLMRIISAGRDPHPFHAHGNNFIIIARDGRLLGSAPAAGADLAVSDFTITVTPGGTADALFTWTGEKLGWDIYGHAAGDPMEPNEYAPDHGKPFPVILPSQQAVTNGNMWSGSPFLGALGALPPGQGGFNPNGGYTFMWHSHNEKEMTNFDIFPGGMMTMLIIEAPSVEIME